ncbi:protoporphyrinogen oxidase HemJ [Acetobacteraceae bacterium H6797]|nr:protoporphyrinogen oxidase HemJ [Acetobacteraceae bacterium H6797]
MPTIDALSGLYPWTKALHLIAVIAWMAALLYLPRLFVYHSQVPVQSQRSEMLKVMERRLASAIMNPAMIAVWVLGICLVLTPGVIDWHAGWWHTKLLMVVLLTGAHHVLTANLKRFARDERPKSERYWRVMNEVPTVLMIIIVVMVIARPF